MLELGINTFVCLQAEVNINTPEHAWRAGHGLRPYIKDAQVRTAGGGSRRFQGRVGDMVVWCGVEPPANLVPPSRGRSMPWFGRLPGARYRP